MAYETVVSNKSLVSFDEGRKVLKLSTQDLAF